ncbi:hypothetical protein V6N12_036282 [Hibiscus sabdariffa]|uniref:Uncharacterized protein n=1 Tax=Hibiscus sabdariffa TaxID=183260 RepID=A0ABR2EU44_9ROSI
MVISKSEGFGMAISVRVFGLFDSQQDLSVVKSSKLGSDGVVALEDVSHLFRGCVEAQALWHRLIKDKLNEFLLMESKHWVLIDLHNENYFPINEADRDVFFGSILWTLWRNRNARIFTSDTCDPESVIQRSQRLPEESLRARLPA